MALPRIRQAVDGQLVDGRNLVLIEVPSCMVTMILSGAEKSIDLMPLSGISAFKSGREVMSS